MQSRFPFTLPKFTSDKSRYTESFRNMRKSRHVKIGAAAAAAIAAAGIVTTTVTTSATSPASAAADLKAASQTHNPAPAASQSPAKAKAVAHTSAPAKPAPAKPKAAPTHAAAPAKPAKPAKPAPKAPAHKAPARKAPAHKAPAHKAPAHKAPVHKVVRKDYRIYDSVTPSSLPAHNEAAIYSNGNYAASRSSVAGRPMLYIDTNGSNPGASVLDVEPGDATPSGAAVWAHARLSHNPHALARIYTMRSEWAATKAAINRLPASMRSRVRWWIADPTGTPHIVPGSDATQWYWGSNYDISTATPRFG